MSTIVTGCCCITTDQGYWAGTIQPHAPLPTTVATVAQRDQATTFHTAPYDDGPKTESVTITTITTVNSVDPAAATLSSASFRCPRATDIGMEKIAKVEQGADAAHWTIVTADTRTHDKPPTT